MIKYSVYFADIDVLLLLHFVYLHLIIFLQYKFAVVVMGRVEHISDEDQNIRVDLDIFKPHAIQGTKWLIYQCKSFSVIIILVSRL